MCGRIAVTLPHDAMAQIFAARPSNHLPNLPNFNLCPTNQLAVVRSGALGRELVSMRWGFLPSWYKSETDGPLLINARAETLADKPAFSDAARSRRCLIPVSGFYEWSKDADGQRLPWYSSRSDGDVMALAGIWQNWGADQHNTCAVVTTAANPDIQMIHHRMPLILGSQDWALWLGEAGHGAARLMKPSPTGILRTHRVGQAVNSNRAKGEALIEPFEVIEESSDPPLFRDQQGAQGRLF